MENDRREPKLTAEATDSHHLMDNLQAITQNLDPDIRTPRHPIMDNQRDLLILLLTLREAIGSQAAKLKCN